VVIRAPSERQLLSPSVVGSGRGPATPPRVETLLDSHEIIRDFLGFLLVLVHVFC